MHLQGAGALFLVVVLDNTGFDDAGAQRHQDGHGHGRHHEAAPLIAMRRIALMRISHRCPGFRDSRRRFTLMVFAIRTHLNAPMHETLPERIFWTFQSLVRRFRADTQFVLPPIYHVESINHRKRLLQLGKINHTRYLLLIEHGKIGVNALDYRAVQRSRQF